MTKEFALIIVGVGGQGIIIMSELVGKAAIGSDLRVSGSETIGIAQRGAPVSSMLRLGSAHQTPLISPGKGDIMIALEPVEALRNLPYMSKSSHVVLNTQRIVPVTALLIESTYLSLENILERLRKNSARVVVSLDAMKLAEKAGSRLSANMVMLGAAFGTGLFPIKTETIKATIETRFSGKVRLTNMMAFDLGYQAYQQALN